VDTSALAEKIRPEIARFKQPKKMYKIDEVPRNTMGKVQKNVLRETYADIFNK
jgi:malonyl-CoA/methylmalonyl-CoA synthetase